MMIGTPANGTKGFGNPAETPRKRLPFPAAKMTAVSIMRVSLPRPSQDPFFRDQVHFGFSVAISP
jgi:hypothetical protein